MEKAKTADAQRLSRSSGGDVGARDPGGDFGFGGAFDTKDTLRGSGFRTRESAGAFSFGSPGAAKETDSDFRSGAGFDEQKGQREIGFGATFGQKSTPESIFTGWSSANQRDWGDAGGQQESSGFEEFGASNVVGPSSGFGTIAAFSEFGKSNAEGPASGFGDSNAFTAFGASIAEGSAFGKRNEFAPSQGVGAVGVEERKPDEGASASAAELPET